MSLDARISVVVIAAVLMCISGEAWTDDDALEESIVLREPWPNAEERAFEEARAQASKAYVACLESAYRDDRDLTDVAAQVECQAERDRYADRVPADLSADIVADIAFQAREKIALEPRGFFD